MRESERGIAVEVRQSDEEVERGPEGRVAQEARELIHMLAATQSDLLLPLPPTSLLLHSLLQVLLAATASPYLIALAAAAGGICPLPVLAALLLSLPAAKALLDYAWTHHTDPARIAILKRYGLKWHMAVGAALVAGLAGAKVLVP